MLEKVMLKVDFGESIKWIEELCMTKTGSLVVHEDGSIEEVTDEQILDELEIEVA